jgi:hypothetical protein
VSDVLKREELYELVWSESLIKIAKQFGWSLGKLETVCREMEIPFPPLGRHAHFAAGRTVERAPLPPLTLGGKAEVSPGYEGPGIVRGRPIIVGATGSKQRNHQCDKILQFSLLSAPDCAPIAPYRHFCAKL